MTQIDLTAALRRIANDMYKTHSGKDASLHHVYIQAEKLPIPIDDEEPVIPIKQAFLDNIANTTRMYPDMPVTIWVDFYGRGNNSTELMDKLNDHSPIPGATFCSLDNALAGLDSKMQKSIDVIFQREHTDFKDSSSPIWQQVDLARTLVLKHVLENPDMPEHAIYADMDIIPNEAMFKILDLYGIATARNYSPDQSMISQKIENRVFGMSREYLSFLKDDLLPRMIEATEEYHFNGWHGHIASFSRSPEIRKETEGDINKILFYTDEIDYDDEIKNSYQQDPTTDEIEALKVERLQAVKDEDFTKACKIHGVIIEKQAELEAPNQNTPASPENPNSALSTTKNHNGLTP